MPLMPKRVKYRKSQKGRVRGNATRGNYVAFGEYGLQTLEPGRISAQTIEAGRVVASQSIKGGGKLYIRIFPHKSITSIPAETRMGKGKGRSGYVLSAWFSSLCSSAARSDWADVESGHRAAVLPLLDSDCAAGARALGSAAGGADVQRVSHGAAVLGRPADGDAHADAS